MDLFGGIFITPKITDFYTVPHVDTTQLIELTLAFSYKNKKV